MNSIKTINQGGKPTGGWRSQHVAQMADLVGVKSRSLYEGADLSFSKTISKRPLIPKLTRLYSQINELIFPKIR
jgi:hypothetical protein